MRENIDWLRSSLKMRWLVNGIILTLIITAVVEFINRALFPVASPVPYLILAVIYTTLRHGPRSGFISAAIGWLYLAHFYSSPGVIFQFTRESLTHVLVVGIIFAAVILLVYRYRSKLDREHLLLLNQVAETKRSEVQWWTLLEAAPDAIIVVNQGGNIHLVNAQAENLFGYARTELVGQPLEKLMPESFRQRHVTHRMSYTRDPHTRPMGSTLELYGLRKDGSTFPVEISLSPIQMESEMLFAAAIRDTTERKQHEEALRERERQFRFLAENSPDTIYILDLIAHDVTYLNRSEFLGYSESELKDSVSILYAINPDDREQVLSHWQTLTSNSHRNGNSETEYRLQAKSGQWHWVHSREAIFASSSEGKPEQLLVTLTDITERKRLEEQQMHSRLERERVEILQQFMSAASHDFRTPLTVMVTSIYLLRKTIDTEKRLVHLQTLENQVKLIEKQLDDMFTLMKLDLADSQFQFERCDLNSLFSDVIEQFHQMTEQKHQQIVLELQPDLPRISVAKAEIALALKNLVENAVAFTPEGGTITLKTFSENQQIVVEVCDTGIGIGAEYLDSIFERFYRVDKARTSGMGSSGLGLPIAKKIIEAQGGRIEVESTPGVGSVFRVRLPVVGTASEQPKQ